MFIGVLNSFAHGYGIIILFIIFLILTVFSAKIKGYIGEKTVVVILSRLDSEIYKVINDITIETGKGTSQIDHVIISKYGVFVIETKNYKGWIFGDDYSQYWTQVIYKRKEKLYNPIKQNYGHVQALKSVLQENFPNIKYIPIVVFPIKSTLKVKTRNHVIYGIRLLKTIKTYQEENLTTNEMNTIYSQLSSLNKKDRQTKKEHVKNIQQKKNNMTQKTKGNICPKCGSQLIVRKGKFGNFKGCSGYPKCRYTANLKSEEQYRL
jgi:hypothetical protein